MYCSLSLISLLLCLLVYRSFGVLYLVINLFTTVPLHNGVQRRTQESAVSVSLVLSAVGHCVCDITEYLEHKMIQVHVHKQVYCVYLYLHTQLATF